MHHRAAVFLFLLPLAALPAQNTTRKIRAVPSSQAARAGSAVEWRESLAAALLEAKERGLPVFWYVPTVQGSPMDRQPEIDRYLLAGPFSWPSTIALLNERTVPVREPARGEAARAHGLRRLAFLEPGWLLLDGDGKELQRLDQLTTFHPQWFEAPLRRALGLPPGDSGTAAALQDLWSFYRQGDVKAVERGAAAVLEKAPAPAIAAEARFLHGAALARHGRMADARDLWRRLAEELPEEPLSWKAAAEAEGHGPFARGFEDFLPLPEPVLREQPNGSRAPASSYAVDELWRRGAAFLVAMEEGDGMIRDSIYDFGGTDSLPNVHAAVTCLAGMALLEAVHRQEALQLPETLRQRAEQVLARILGGAATDGALALQDRDEILWAFAYRVRFLCRWIALRPQDRAARLIELRLAVQRVQDLQPENGAWFHEYPNPFAIATALQCLHEARQHGAAVDQEKIDRGLRALVHCRAQNGAYTYGYGRGGARASVEAAAGRMPLCELAILQWRASGTADLAAAVTAAMQHHGLLAAVRKYDDHADQHGYGGFFFWFDMLGRAEAIMALPAGADRERWRAQQRKLVLDLPEFDGVFVDSHELGRAYGTAMALLSFAALDG